jgi:DnaJ-class molecular chaperone
LLERHCAACHNGDYNNTPNTCAGCHTDDYNNTTNPDHEAQQFPLNCEECHGQSAWNTIHVQPQQLAADRSLRT